MTEYNGYIIAKDPKFPQYLRVKIKGGGKTPAALSGSYTSSVEIKRAIDTFKRNFKEKVDGKTKSASRSKQLPEGVDNGSKSAESSSGVNES